MGHSEAGKELLDVLGKESKERILCAIAAGGTTWKETDTTPKNVAQAVVRRTQIEANPSLCAGDLCAKEQLHRLSSREHQNAR